MKGMLEQRINKVINTEISHLQIHHPDFRKSSDFEDYIPEGESFTEQVRQLEAVVGVSNRIVVQSMVSSAETAAGVMILGVDPDQEQKVTNLYTKIIDGAYFEGISRNPVVIGKKLAEKLNVKIRSKIVITAQDLDNNIMSGAFRVAGIFTTNNNMYDESHIFVRYSDLVRLTAFPEGAGHEIAVSIRDNEQLQTIQKSIQTISGDNEVLNWKELSPEMNYMTESMDLYMYIFILIILLALLFGIINTMLMVVMERTKEIGMLLAIGMHRSKIFSMIVLESVMLSLVGGLLGIAVGAAVARIRSHHPIDLSQWAAGYEAIGYDSFVYLKLQPELLVNVALMVIFTGIIAALYPAYKALRNDPADALRIE
jgi:ABC-type lipoprotein release transport system permease subunit